MVIVECGMLSRSTSNNLPIIFFSKMILGVAILDLILSLYEEISQIYIIQAIIFLYKFILQL